MSHSTGRLGGPVRVVLVIVVVIVIVVAVVVVVGTGAAFLRGLRGKRDGDKEEHAWLPF